MLVPETLTDCTDMLETYVFVLGVSFSVTLTVQLALTPLYVAVMVQVPLPWAVIWPPPTVATPELLVVQTALEVTFVEAVPLFGL